MPLYISDYDENGIDRNAPDSPIAHEDGKAQYHYDSKGEYTTTGKTQFIRGVHLASAMATMIAPPNATNNQIYIMAFDGSYVNFIKYLTAELIGRAS
jgi:hypothetical protein